MKHLVHYEGSGEGCDYTIGCNHAIRFVNADSIKGAVKEISDRLLSEDSWYNPSSLAKVTIYEIGEETSLNLVQINKLRREVAEKQDKRAEVALYERLKAKYE